MLFHSAATCISDGTCGDSTLELDLKYPVLILTKIKVAPERYAVKMALVKYSLCRNYMA